MPVVEASSKRLAAAPMNLHTVLDVLGRRRTLGDSRQVDLPARGSSGFQAWRRPSTSSTHEPARRRGTRTHRPRKAVVMKPPIWTLGTGPHPGATEMGWDRLRPLSYPKAGLKPMADETRRMPPFGSPKRCRTARASIAATHRRSRKLVRLIHPKAKPLPVSIDIGACGIVRRSCLRSAWTARQSPAFVRPPAAPREVRLNGFPGGLAEVLRHRVGGRGRWVAHAAPTAVFGASKVGQPAYPLSYNGAGEGWPPPPLRSPRCSRSRGGRGRGLRPPPPVPVRRDA